MASVEAGNVAVSETKERGGGGQTGRQKGERHKLTLGKISGIALQPGK